VHCVTYWIDAAVRAPYLPLIHALAHISKLADAFRSLAMGRGNHPSDERPMTSLQNLTAADRALHEIELEMLRKQLFCDHTPQSLYIIAEPEVIAASVVVCWYPEPPRRTLLKGGLRYLVHIPGAHGPAEFCVQHWIEDSYWLRASYVDYRGAAYNRFSLTRSLKDLPGGFVRCVKEMEREHATGRAAPW
jgi:hypothetical protein